jgi:hypothetical protein
VAGFVLKRPSMRNGRREKPKEPVHELPKMEKARFAVNQKTGSEGGLP